MGDIAFSDGNKLAVDSKHMILDSGLSYALIPTSDFKTLTETLEKKYGVACAKKAAKDKNSAQIDASDCTCKDVASLPSLSINLRASKDDQTGKAFTMPRETYIKDAGNGKCQLLLNPNEMQIGARYGENYWVMGDQFMQAYYTIFDKKNWRVGLVESKNVFDSSESGPKPDTVKSVLQAI